MCKGFEHFRIRSICEHKTCRSAFFYHEHRPKFHIFLPSFGKGKTKLSIFQADRSLCDHALFFSSRPNPFRNPSELTFMNGCCRYSNLFLFGNLLTLLRRTYQQLLQFQEVY